MNLNYGFCYVISGIGKNSTGNFVEAAANYLGKGKETGRDAKTNEFTKNQEAKQSIQE
jgi:hypothetical protein